MKHIGSTILKEKKSSIIIPTLPWAFSSSFVAKIQPHEQEAAKEMGEN